MKVVSTLREAVYGNQIKTLKHGDFISSSSFSPEGKTIASASWDNTVKLWNWDFDNLVNKGCERFKYHLADNPEKLAELEVCQNK